MKYESLTKAPQPRFSLTKNQNSVSAADEAQALIAASKRQRAGTVPPKNNTGMASSPIYHPPRFADQCICTSKQFQNRKNNKMAMKDGTQSTPVSPKYSCQHDDKDNDGDPPTDGPVLQNISIIHSRTCCKKTKNHSKPERGKGKTEKEEKFCIVPFLKFSCFCLCFVSYSLCLFEPDYEFAIISNFKIYYVFYT